MLVEMLFNWDSFQENSREQDISRVTKAPKLDRSFSYVNWEFDSPDMILRRQQALGYRYPLASYFRGQPIFLFNVILAVVHGQILSDNPMPSPGTLFRLGDDVLMVQTSSPYHVLQVSEVRVGSRNTITARDFLKGYQFKHGEDKLVTYIKEKHD